MSIYVKRKANVQIYASASEKDCLFAPNDSLAETITASHLRFVAGRFSVAASASEALSMGDVTTPRGIYIRFDGNAQLVMNSGAQTFDVQPEASSVAGGTANGTFFMTGTISAAQVTNPSTSSALTGQYVVWGD